MAKTFGYEHAVGVWDWFYNKGSPNMFGEGLLIAVKQATWKRFGGAGWWDRQELAGQILEKTFTFYSRSSKSFKAKFPNKPTEEQTQDVFNFLYGKAYREGLTLGKKYYQTRKAISEKLAAVSGIDMGFTPLMKDPFKVAIGKVFAQLGMPDYKFDPE